MELLVDSVHGNSLSLISINVSSKDLERIILIYLAEVWNVGMGDSVSWKTMLFPSVKQLAHEGLNLSDIEN